MQRRRSHKTRSHAVQYSLSILLLLILTIGSSTSAQGNVAKHKPASQNVAHQAQEVPPTEPSVETTEQPESPEPAPETTAEAPGETPTDVATTTTPTETATATATATPAPTSEATDEPSPEATAEVTDEPSPEATAEATDEPSPEATAEATDEVLFLGDGPIMLLGFQTSCQIDSAVQATNDPYTYTFTASGNDIETFAWDFPGGLAVDSTDNPVTWDFNVAGTYLYSLTCTSTVDTGALVLGPIQGSVAIFDPVVVSFNYNTTSNPDTPSVTVNAASTSSGHIASYSWVLSTHPTDATDVPSQIASGVNTNFTHTFTVGNPPPGVPVYIHLTVTGLSGASEHIVLPAGGLSLTLPPKATFTLTPISANAPLDVTFTGDDSAGGAVTSWSWDFGDGSPVDTTTGANPTHQYTVPGIYTVTLNYSNDGGGGTVTKQVLVVSTPDPVNAIIGGVTFEGTNGSIVACYTNTSTGPFVVSDWNFGDGSPIVRTNDQKVCHTYASEAEVEVILNVCSLLESGTVPDPGVPCLADDGGVPYDGYQSEAKRTVNLIASPVANFTSVSTVEWGTVVNLTNTSTGQINTYAWDLNADGTPDIDGVFNDGTWSPSNVVLNQLGTNLIRLTVVGPGGVSYVEHAIEVTRRDITCSISGATNVLPTVLSSDYLSQVNNLNFAGFTPRTATYSWTLYKGATQLLTSSTPNLAIDWTTYGNGTFTLTLDVLTSDGANCTATQTITRDYLPVACEITTPSGFSPTLYANGQSYTFSADVDNLEGRTHAFQWSVNGTPQPGETGSSFTWQNTNVEPGASTPVKISYSVTVTNPDSTVLPPCVEELNINVIPWPLAVDICNSLSVNGNFTPLPFPGQDTYTYTASLNSGLIAGRTVTYAWTVDNPPGEVVGGTSSSSVVVRWHAQTPPIAPGSPQSYANSLRLQVTVTNPDASVGASCLDSKNISVTVQQLACAAPTGDLTPLVDETLNYNALLSNVYSRTLSNVTWTLTKVDAVGNPIALPVTFTYPGASVTASTSGNSGSTQLLNQYFPTAGERFTLSYSASVAADVANNIAASTCDSAAITLEVRGTGVIFECESSVLGGLTSIPNAAGQPFNYTIPVDNGNGLILSYLYKLEMVDSSGVLIPGRTKTFTAVTSPNDGTIGKTFTFDDLSDWGAGRYRLSVVVSNANTAHTCGASTIITVGNLGVNYNYTIAPSGSQTWTADAFPIGQEICLDNVTTPTPADTNVSYTWSISPSIDNTLPGGTNYNAEELPCFTFTEEGNYTVTLTGSNDSGTTVPGSSHSVVFRAYGLQSIAITRTGSLVENSINIFTAPNENIDSFQWIFYRLNTSTNTYEQIATDSGISVNRSFPTAGQYRARVIGTGDLGNTEASLDFEIMPADSIAARFSAAPSAGIAPYQVCFTDRSVSNPTNIVTWEWSFGDGGSSTEQNPCHTYQTSGTNNKYNVTLRVWNVAGRDAQATSVIRTYSLLEMSVNFSYEDRGGGLMCFTPQDIPADVIVTGWSFGDGSPFTPAVGTGGLGEICHTYAVLGQTYTVVMHVEGPGGEEGEHSNDVTPRDTPPEPPVLAIDAVCGLDRVAVFTITNTGGEASDSVTIRNTTTPPGQIVYLSSHTFPDGTGTPSVTTITVPNQSGTLTLSLINHTGRIIGGSTVTTNCNYPPEIVITVQCVGNLPVFTITNNRLGDGPMVAAQQYTITDSSSNTIATGSFQLQSADTSQPETLQIPVTNQNPYLNYTFSTTGTVVIVHAPVSSSCAAPAPSLSIEGVCEGAFTFRITNSAQAGDMVQPQSYTILDSSSNPVAGGSGTFQLDAGETATITLPDTLNPYATYTLQSDGYAGTLDFDHPCASPSLTPSRECAYPVVFTITNNGSNMLEEMDYTVEDSSGDLVAGGSGSFQLNAGESHTITLTGLDPYASYTLKSSGFAGTINYTPDPCVLPAFTVTYTCAYPLVFTITNNGQLGDMLTAQAYTVEDADGTEVASGTFQLDVGATYTIPLTGLDPYASYTLKSSGFAGDIDETPAPCGQPSLTPVTQCAETVSFTVTNDGAGDMLTAQTYSITDASGSAVTAYTVTDDNGDPVIPGEMQLAVGASITITLTGANPYSEFTFSTSGFAGTASLTHECDDPVLDVTYTCAGAAAFTVTNLGGDMLTEHSFDLFFDGSQRVTPADNKFLLKRGESLTINVPSGLELWRGIRFVTDELGISADVSFECVEPGSLLEELELEPTLTPDSVVSGFRGLTLGDAPNWNAVCGSNCPPFRVYHTDETGNWNIFRLDGANAETEETFRRNLSYGVGENVRDMHPSLSPNNEWVVFSSNRDGNWEIYVASTSGDPSSIQRVTRNTIASDTNPVWGPNNFVVYQSTRNGNWDLYAVDMETGIEYQLTDDSADETNPTWSPDGSRILFQSNRADENGDRKWQLYELSLGSGDIRRLSDGTSIDVDPQYSNNGSQIVFRSYTETDSSSSRLMLINANGSNRRAITTEGEDATNPAWSPQDRYIAYQSDLDGDLDIYVYEVATGQTRHLTDNDIPDYAPTWLCDEEHVIFTSDIDGTPDLYEEEVQPINGEPVSVDLDAEKLTFEPASNIYPLGSPLFEAASLEGQTSTGVFGEQTIFLRPSAGITPDDSSIDGVRRDDWRPITGCP